MIRQSLIAVVFGSLLAAACSKHQPPPQQAAVPAPAAPSPEQLAHIKVVTMRVVPQTVGSGQQATVSIELSDVPPGTDVTLAWFGPDGWLKYDAMSAVEGRSVSFVVPPGTFDEAGRYHAALRAGVVHLADATLDVRA